MPRTGGKKRFPVGHTGTLDPLATGLLVLLLGTYTKRAPQLAKLDKTYAVTMRLGISSSTGDEEGEKKEISGLRPSALDVQVATQHFQGHLMQTPPIFSAIKVGGKRAYALARAGKVPQLEARPVEVYGLRVEDYAYPYIRCVAHVSSGTYIRSLVTDIGDYLSTGAYMSALKRIEVGRFNLKDALTIEEVTWPELQKAVEADI